MALACFALLASAPLMAQEETPPADAAATDAPAADAPATDASAAPADSSSSTDAASSDSSSASDSSSSDSSSSDSSAASATDSSSESSDTSAAIDNSELADTEPGFPLYLGLEYDTSKIEIAKDSTQAKFGGARRYGSDFYKLRVGARIFEAVGFELQAGVPNRKGDIDDNDLKTKSFYGAYIVPTGVAFDLLEISARLGYSYAKWSAGGSSETTDGVSYGLAIEFPLTRISEGMPNIRITTAGTVYQQDHDVRSYGWSAGLRYDFNL
jgi:hypothetical protein